VKIFPGDSVGGPDFVKAILGPCPWTRVMATGGVDSTEESLRSWFEAGVACVGMGTKLITKELLLKQDYEGIEVRIRETLQLVRAIRGQVTCER
jgi:2-dehydro-3-deoxyphosphogluconate aldolase/(4S)-4-hydroxy-2-oxoglutarate aldolase